MENIEKLENWDMGKWGNMKKYKNWENLEKCPKKEGPKTMLEMTAAKFWAFSIPEDMESVKFWKIQFLGQI